MKAWKLGFGAVSALVLIGATAGSVRAQSTELVDQDSFTFSGNLFSGGGQWQFVSNSCTGTSISTVGESSELVVDIEKLDACQVQMQGTCVENTNGGQTWTGTISIMEGQNSDNYSGPLTVTWSGGTGTMSGVLSETEPSGPEDEPPAPMSGTLTLPPGANACFFNGPMSGNLSTTA
jgi:hypothetical protein